MILEQLQPYITTVVEALLGLLVTSILGFIAVMRGKLNAWLEAHTTAAQRETLARLAGEAAALVESAWKEQGNGPQKMKQAIDYVMKRAAELGITLNIVSIQAAVEKAVQDYNAQVKGAV